MRARINQIEVWGLLFSRDFLWELGDGVNILSGGNGSGKSTLLRAVAQQLQDGQLSGDSASMINKLYVLCQGDITPRSVISNFDVGAIDIDALAGVEQGRLDNFYDILDRLFHSTGKSVLRGRASGDVRFNLHVLQQGRDNVELCAGQLSSGERSILQLFASILVNKEASILILDEPEISLSIEWQKNLLSDILSLNDNLQILVATHSPAIVMNGWLDKIFEIPVPAGTP